MTNTMTHGMLSEEDFLAHVGATPDMTEDEFLEHFGVKGMRWGHRNAGGGGSSDSAGGGGRRPKLGPDGKPAKTRKELRALDKASEKKDFDKWNADIDSARSRTRGKENVARNKQELKDAKTKFKVDKKVIGRREATKALQAVRQQKMDDAAVAARAKTGRETVTAVLGTVAAAVVVGAVLR